MAESGAVRPQRDNEQRRGRSGLDALRRWWPERWQQEPSPAVVSLVLSGGGANACFQLGALRYLYDVVGIAPTVITGTSAGAILAALLAQSDEYAGQRQILEQIEQTYETLRHRGDIMVELDWFTALQKLVPALQRVGQARTPDLHAGQSARPRGSTSPRRPDGALRDRFRGAAIRLPRWDSTPMREVLSTLWTLSRSRPDFDALLRGGRQEQSLYRRGPLFDRLLGPDVFDSERLACSATELRIAVVGLESGELRYVTGRGVLVDRADQLVPGAEPVGVVDAVHASCAIPGIYRPVQLNGEHYVDGGTRENLAVDIAMTQLGSTRCYAINSVPTGLPPDASYADKDMLAIVLRTTSGIMFDEMKLSGVARAEEQGAVLIAPEVDVLGVLEIDPGLLAIAKDYGFLRAAEACEEASVAEQRVTRTVIELRRRIWQEENELVAARAADPLVDPPRHLTTLKRELRDLVAQVPAARLPADAEQWWQRWERHQVDISSPVPWLTDPPAVPDSR